MRNTLLVLAVLTTITGCAGSSDDVGLTSASLQTVLVNTTSDGDGNCADGYGNCTLRAALMEAASATDDVEIVLGAGVYELTEPPGSTNETGTDQGGDLDVYTGVEVTIRGASMHGTRIVAAGLDRVMHVRACSRLALTNLSLEGGVVPALGSIEPNRNRGGGLLNDSACHVELDHVRVAENLADVGGGLDNEPAGELSLRYVDVRRNRTLGPGGAGIASFGVLNMETSTVADGEARSAGTARTISAKTRWVASSFAVR